MNKRITLLIPGQQIIKKTFFNDVYELIDSPLKSMKEFKTLEKQILLPTELMKTKVIQPLIFLKHYVD